MARSAIFGDRGTLRVLENGQVKNLYTVINWSFREDAQENVRNYAGEAFSHKRKVIMGWTGRITLDVVNAELDLLIQRINDASHAGVNVPEITLALVERYGQNNEAPDTAHIFSGCILIYDEHSGGGQPDLVQKSFTVSAARKRTEPL